MKANISDEDLKKVFDRFVLARRSVESKRHLVEQARQALDGAELALRSATEEHVRARKALDDALAEQLIEAQCEAAK